MFHISSPIVLFSYGKVKDIFGRIRIKFHWGGQKERIRGGMGEKPKMSIIFAKFPLLSKIQTLSHKHLVKLLTITIAIGMPKNLYAGISK